MNSQEENIEAEQPIEESDETTPNRTLNRKVIVVSSIVLAVLLLSVIGFVYLHSGSSGEGRPVPTPRNVSLGNSNSAPTAGEETITILPEQVERAGIKVETVGEKLAPEGGTTLTTGVIQPNAYRETPVNSLVGGVVRRVNVELGKQVRKGQTLAVVFSEELSQTESRYLTAQTELDTARKNYEREARLVRISPASNTELDEAKAKLVAAEAELDEHHKHHVRTMKLVEIGATSREEMEQATTMLKTSEANAEEARRRYERAVQVADINPVNRASFEEAAVKLRSAESDVTAQRERLRLLGLPQEKIDSLRSTSQISSELAITAPVSGTVTTRNVNGGEVVEANKELIRVTDLTAVWAIAQVYENELGRIRTGSGASVTSTAYPDQVFRGQVSYIDPNINQETRTAQTRIELANPGQTLRIGMYVNIAFANLGESEKTMPVVPTSAVQNVNDRQVVFVATDQPNVFIMRPVRLASEASGLHPVIEGITVGDRIVTDGSFFLRAEWLKLHPNEN